MTEAPVERRSAASGRLGQLCLLGFASLWVIILNNARIGDNLPADTRFALLAIPREARVVEAAAVFALFLVHQRALWRSPLRDFTVVVWLFLLAAVASMIRTPTLYVSQAQGIYVYVAPFLVFAWASMVRPDWRLVRQLVTIFSVYLAMNIAVALLVQLPIVRVKSDLIHGLYSDAHAFGTFLAVGSCVAFSRFLAAGGATTLLVAAALFLVSYFPANEKMIVFNVVWCLAALCWRLVHHPRSRRALGVAAACGLAVWAGAVGSQSASQWLRLEMLTGQRLNDLGPIRSWRLAGRTLDAPSDLLVGLGPANYAGVVAARTVLNQPRQYEALSVRARAALSVDSEALTSGISWMTNTWANLLAEFGLIGMALFSTVLYRVAVPIYRWRPSRTQERFARLLCLAMLASIIWQGFMSPYTNWADPILSYPSMVLAAYCHVRLHGATSRTATADAAPAG
jgi:hypothetical protein